MKYIIGDGIRWVTWDEVIGHAKRLGLKAFIILRADVLDFFPLWKDNFPIKASILLVPVYLVEDESESTEEMDVTTASEGEHVGEVFTVDEEEGVWETDEEEDIDWEMDDEEEFEIEEELGLTEEDEGEVFITE